MIAGSEKLTKIRLECIEETIKKIETFNSNLKKFRDRDSIGGERIKKKRRILPLELSKLYLQGKPQ